MHKYKWIVSIFVVWLWSILSSMAFSQVTVEASPKRIKIGEQFKVTLTAPIEDGKIIVWPGLSDTLTKQLEIVSKSGLDTITLSNGKSAYTQTLQVTSFDSGYFKIPPFQFKYITSGDTTISESSFLGINVTGVAVDTTKGFRDISGPLDAPYTFRDALPYLIGVVGILVIGLVLYFIIQKIRNKPKKEIVTPQAPPVPAHVKALAQLTELKEKQLYQQGKIKAFYTELVDIFKVYYMERYGIDTLEMTSAELMVVMQSIHLEKTVYQSLGDTLRRADLVKFAKATPLIQEHEASLEVISQFISITAEPVSQIDQA